MPDLTDEDFYMYGWMENPRFNYKKQFKRLQKIHDFQFDGRQKLIPQRKTAIRKAFNKYRKYLSKIESNTYTFVPAKKSQIKNLKEQFPVSNKGLIYNHPMQPDAERETKIFGVGKKTRLVDTISLGHPGVELKGLKQFKFYLPFPLDLSVAMRETWIDYINDTLNPHYIAMAINGYSGHGLKLPESAGQYASDLVDKLGKKGKEILTGIYIVFFKRGGGKWLKGIEQKTKLLY